MNKPVELINIQPDVIYYTDTAMDCEVKLNRVKNNTIFFDLISETNGGYIQEPDGTLAFPLNEFVYFYEK
jgi:hypothetical protein